MISQYVRVAGNVYGPFGPEQLAQMRATGRINDQSEVSADRVTWRPLGGGLGGVPQPAPTALAPGFTRADAAGGATTRDYLEQLRNRTQYPFYRTTVLVASIVGYVVAAMPVVALLVQVVWFGLSSISILQPLAMVIGSVLIAVVVTVAREIASMYADFVDSTLARHAREER